MKNGLLEVVFHYKKIAVEMTVRADFCYCMTDFQNMLSIFRGKALLLYHIQTN